MTRGNHIQTPAAWLARAVQSRPAAEAIRWDSGSLSYLRLYAHSEALARRLAQQLPQDATLAIRLGSRRQMAQALYAGLHLGVPLLPLDPRLPLEMQRKLCAQVTPCVLLSDRPAEAALPVTGKLPAELLQDGEQPRAPLPRQPAGDAIRLIVPTSGSSGEPKAAMLSADNIASAVRAARGRIPLGPEDTWLACLPLFHIGGLSILLRCLEVGAAVLLHERFDPGAVWRDINTARVTHLSLVPVMLQRLLESTAGCLPPHSLRTVLVGGATLDPELALRARDAGWPLCVSYGMSEASSQVATLCSTGAGIEAGRVGAPLAGFEVRIAAANSQGLGRILLRGPALMAGYAAPGLEPGRGLVDGWLESGDLGRLDVGGGLTVLGRADDVLISGGEKIHPSRVEPVLRRCPGVAEAALSAREDPLWGDRLVAVYVGGAEPQQLEMYCRERLGGAALPREFIRVQELPLGASSKLDRRELRRLLRESSRQGPGRP